MNIENPLKKDISSLQAEYDKIGAREGISDELISRIFSNLNQESYGSLDVNEQEVLSRLHADVSLMSSKDHPSLIKPFIL
ncbi:MAG: hypothetical protein JSS09_03510 [Verrucomicrobia bacterium]|nr:hypothetical protein [Verrucomicrobiota bacterium]